MKCPTCNGTGECDEVKVIVNNITILDREISDEDMRTIVERVERHLAMRSRSHTSILSDVLESRVPVYTGRVKEADIPKLSDCAVVYESAH